MSIKQRLYPKPGQVAGLAMHAAHVRFVWNIGLEQRNFWRPHHKGRRAPITMSSQMRELAELRRAEEWLAAGSSSVQQAALRDLHRAFVNWWKNPTHFRRPTWRRAGVHEGFYVRDLKVRQCSRRTGQVHVPKVGWVKFRLTRPFAEVAAATSARVTLRGGRWHVSFTTAPRRFERKSTGAVVGIDRGVTNTLATSEGALAHAPVPTAGEQRRFLALQQRLARQRKGSNRRAVTREKISRMQQRWADRRRDWVEQTTTTLVRDYDLIAIENLNITGMVRRPRPKPDPNQPGAFLPNGARAKAALNRSIHASVWGTFAQRLADKAAQTPDGDRTAVIAVDPKNTSRQCPACGHVAAENRESQALFACQSCGHTAHADLNAAHNILARAITTLPEPGYAAGRAVNGRIRPTPVGRVNQPEPARQAS